MRKRSLFVLLLFVLLTACGDSTGPNGASVAGTYVLQTVNGQALPRTVVQNGQRKIEFVAAEMSLERDRTWNQLSTFRTTDGASVTSENFVASGTYHVEDRGTLRFSYDDGSDAGQGVVNRTTLTRTTSGTILVFRK